MAFLLFSQPIHRAPAMKSVCCRTLLSNGFTAALTDWGFRQCKTESKLNVGCLSVFVTGNGRGNFLNELPSIVIGTDQSQALKGSSLPFAPDSRQSSGRDGCIFRQNPCSIHPRGSGTSTFLPSDRLYPQPGNGPSYCTPLSRIGTRSINPFLGSAFPTL